MMTVEKEDFHDVALELSDGDDGEHKVLGVDQEGTSKNFVRPYVYAGPQYIPKNGIKKYNSALKLLLPFRNSQKNKKKVIEVDNAGLLSFITFSWLSKYIYKAYREGLSIDDLPLSSKYDSGGLNSQRLELLWETELRRRGSENASFGRSVWKFMQTRIMICSFIFFINCMLGFITPAIFMKKLIQFTEDPDAATFDGIILAVAFTFFELLKAMSGAFYYALSYRTATRLKAACSVLVYKKLVRLNTLGSISIGEIINIFGSDSANLFYMVVFGPMVIGGPIVVICCALYIYFNLGTWALLGLTTFLLFYPLQVSLTMYLHILFSILHRVSFGIELSKRLRSTEVTSISKVWSNVWIFVSQVIGSVRSKIKHYLLSRLTGHFREKAIHVTDKRVMLMTEILSTIKLIKMYAWETCFTKRIQAIRNEELSLLRNGAYCQSFGISLAPTVPVISGILTFVIHVLSGNNLTAAQAYPLVTLLHSQLRTSLLNFRYGSENIIGGLITFRRIQKLLLLEEVKPQTSPTADDALALTMNEGTFVWCDSSELKPSANESKKEDGEKDVEVKNTHHFKIDSINLCITKGSLIGICGIVGSGKSSLLKACLGQMTVLSGEVSRSGKCAYVTQEAWIENTTLKENILFGEPFDTKKYINTLYCCALNEDVNLLPAGDETEIGERGVNLSGGQKQRVQLARALYSNRDIYFLDDPLSAVDSQVAIHIFEKCILGALKRKTVFLVTNQTKFLEKCDEILVMRGGKIVERGSHNELLSKDREYFCLVESNTLLSLENSLENTASKTSDDDIEQTDTCNTVNNEKLAGIKKFIESEDQIRGEVRTSAYHAYINAVGGYFISFLVLLSILINVGSNTFSSWWLAIWLKAGSGNATVSDPITNGTSTSEYINDNPELNFYMQIYACTIGLICATSLLRGVTFTQVTVRASKFLHNMVLEKLMSSFLRHFEVTPIGRIQNIFSRELNEIDFRLPPTIEGTVQNIWLVLFAFLTITLIFPWFAVALIVLGVMYYLVWKIFRVVIRDLKRIQAISKAPILSCVTTTINGLPIIHAFGKESEYVARFCKIFEENNVCSYMLSCAFRWMAVRLDSISGTHLPVVFQTWLNIPYKKIPLSKRNAMLSVKLSVALTTSILVVFLKGEVAPALAGLALTYSTHISGVFQFTLRSLSDMEGQFISVERILTVTEKFKKEGNMGDDIGIPQEWPDKGNCRFQDVKLSYFRDLPPVLNGITLDIKPGQKIGVGSFSLRTLSLTEEDMSILLRIVGRTGAGKSSLVAAIFRLVELAHGTIYIDGIDIACAPLQVLRSRLSVIPQEPVVFNGSLRFNLDPLNKYSDEHIWEVLKLTKLYARVHSMNAGLSTMLGQGGDMLSAGESQLLCLARVLLRGSKILILDEATASVDPETEEIVQGVLGNNFKDCTVLTIAHRLKTIKNCEKVLVIHNGLVQEYDDPQNLLQDPNSLFSKMIKALK